MRFPSFGKLLLAPLLSAIAIVAGFALAVSAFEAHVIGVTAVIENVPGEPGLSCSESREITDILTTSVLIEPVKNIVVRAGGVIESDNRNLVIKTGCDLLVMEGGVIRSSNGKKIKLDAEQNIFIKGSVQANANSPGGQIKMESDNGRLSVSETGVISATGDDGGKVKLEAEFELEMLGLIDAQGLDGRGGKIDIESDGDLIIGSQLLASGTERGGEVGMEAGGATTLNGALIEAKGDQDDGGKIKLDSLGQVTVTDSQLNTQGLGEGGEIGIQAQADIEFDSDSQLKADALAGDGEGGEITIETPGNHLAFLGEATATGADEAGETSLIACTFDTTAAVFDPAAVFITDCPSVLGGLIEESTELLEPEADEVNNELNNGDELQDGKVDGDSEDIQQLIENEPESEVEPEPEPEAGSEEAQVPEDESPSVGNNAESFNATSTESGVTRDEPEQATSSAREELREDTNRVGRDLN